MNDWRHRVDITAAFLTACVALYYRIPAVKRKAFEEKFPRVSALIGMIAGVLPFLPMIVDNAKRLVAPTDTAPIVAHSDSPVPTPPWAESSDAQDIPPPSAKE